jgi:hypothetical protein
VGQPQGKEQGASGTGGVREGTRADWRYPDTGAEG